MKKSWIRAALMLSIVACLMSPAKAGIVYLGGGWAVDIPNAGQVGVVVDAVTADYIAIEISKDFTEGPDDFGNFPAIYMNFMQVAPNDQTVPKIVILDESVTNQTGTTWTDYHMDLIQFPAMHAYINMIESQGFSMAPFATKTTVPWGLSAEGGAGVANNTSFFPGAGNGELVIDINLTNKNGVKFMLKEYPTPEPATLALLTLGGLVAIRRRR
jgi:hypothetical protein